MGLYVLSFRVGLWIRAVPRLVDMWVVVKILVPFWGPYYNTAPNNSGDPKRDHNLTITHMWPTVTIEECSFGSESSKDLNTEVSGLGFRV